jgi:hypothetical protein
MFTKNKSKKSAGKIPKFDEGALLEQTCMVGSLRTSREFDGGVDVGAAIILSSYGYRCTPVIPTHVYSSCCASHRRGNKPEWHHGVKYNWARRQLRGLDCRSSTFIQSIWNI